MNILIITSEPLNPGNTLSSTFELSQANILSGSFNVAILSVQTGESLGAMVKELIRRLAGRSSKKPVANTSEDLVKCMSFIFLGRPVVSKYIINGIPVYEGRGFDYRSNNKFRTGLKVWTRAGMDAFRRYKEATGMPDIIHAHGRFLKAGALALQVKRKYGIPYIYTEHSSFFRRNFVPTEAVPVINDVIDHADLYTAVSADLVRRVESVLGRTIKNPQLTPNVIDPVFEAPLKREGLHDGTIVFIHIASFDENKNQSLLLRAFKNAFGGNKKYRLHICGEGAMRLDLERLTADLEITSVVTFLGRKSKEEIVALLDRSDVFVLSSRTETFGLVLAEAMARGLPVISTRSGGPEDIVNDRCGLLVDSDNEAQMASALEELGRTCKSYDPQLIRQEALDKYGTVAFLRFTGRLYQTLRT